MKNEFPGKKLKPVWKNKVMYRIDFVKSAVKEFNCLNKNIKEKIAKRIDELEINPRPENTKKLKGHNNLYRVRAGDYRIIYQIDDSQNYILITRVIHRKDVYEL